MISDCWVRTQSIVGGAKTGVVVLISIRKSLVDLKYLKQLLINSCFMKEVDIYRVKAEDLTLIPAFCLHVKRNEYIHAMLTYFNVEFTQLKRGLVFLWFRVFSV